MQTIRLSTTPGTVNPGAYLSQYDVGRQILILLYDDTGKYIPSAGSTVHIRATKPSGFGFDVACTWLQNTVTVTVTDEMSNESGSFAAELRIEKDGNILGTANFLWNVERSTHLNGTVDGNTEARGLYQDILDAIDDAEAAAEEAREAAETGSGLTNEAKTALLNCFEHVAWTDEHGQTYYDALYAALYPPIPATSITLNKSTLTFHVLNTEETLVATVLPADTTDAVFWMSSDPAVASVDSSGKVKALANGSATITATAGTKTATCSVTVAEITLSNISAVFTQGSATIYDTDSLDTLKQYLVVTAIYSDSSSEVLDDSAYTLSGTLTVGTPTITASYGGKTDSFSVTVTQAPTMYSITNNLTNVSSSNASTTSVVEHGSFATSLGVLSGYTMQSVTVTMGGVDITSTAYDTQTMAISISDVTGNIVITAVAVAPQTLDTVIYEGKSYRDIFMTANKLQGFDFENGLPSGCEINAGSPEITTEDCYSATHSVKAFGTSSTQYKSANVAGVAKWSKDSNKSYFTAFKGKCTRYVQGSLGVTTNGYAGFFEPITSVTDGWITAHKYITDISGASALQGFIGSYTSANLDGYVDDIVIINMTDLFTTIPSEADILAWYNTYADLRKAGES